MRDFLPQPFVEVLRRKLKPYGWAFGPKRDWFAGRGTCTTRRGTGQGPRCSGMGVSDHDPV